MATTHYPVHTNWTDMISIVYDTECNEYHIIDGSTEEQKIITTFTPNEWEAMFHNTLDIKIQLEHKIR